MTGLPQQPLRAVALRVAAAVDAAGLWLQASALRLATMAAPGVAFQSENAALFFERTCDTCNGTGTVGDDWCSCGGVGSEWPSLAEVLSDD